MIGSRELARLTGAKIVTLDHSLFGHSDIRLQDGEELQLTGLKLRALHTPGHTPESTCYAVYLDEARTWLGGLSRGTRCSSAKRGVLINGSAEDQRACASVVRVHSKQVTAVGRSDAGLAGAWVWFSVRRKHRGTR